MRGAAIGGLDAEGERALRHRVAAIVDLRHDLVAEIEIIAHDHRLLGHDGQLHELRRARRLIRRLGQLRDLIDLPERRLFVGKLQRDAGGHQHRHAEAAAKQGGVRGVAQHGLVDAVHLLATDVLLRDEICGRQRIGMSRIDRWIDAADQRQ